MPHPRSSSAVRSVHLGVFMAVPGSHASGWRLPGAMTRADDFPGLLNVAQIAERAKLDFLFFSDSPLCPLDGPPTAVLRLEPVSVLSALAAATSHIGLVVTISCTFTEPYNLARYVASIDRISGGRAGWNVVTNAEQRVADSFGRTLPPHDTRYAMADEYLQVVQALWDSWEPDAFITDPTSWSANVRPT